MSKYVNIDIDKINNLLDRAFEEGKNIDPFPQSKLPAEYDRPQSREDIDSNIYVGAIEEDVPPEKINSFPELPDDLLVINDILFTDVPVTSIGTESNHDTVVSETLRNRSAVVISKGNRSFRLSLSLVFAPGAPQQKLHRLMSQLTRNPIAFIYSNVIKQRLNIPQSETTIFMLESGNIRNSAKSTGVIALDLHFTYFNYKPFSNSFRFNAKLNGYSVDRSSGPPVDNTKSISDLRGYEASSFLIEKRAEELLNQIDGKINIDLAGKYNSPVTFPSQSDAWQYYADHVQSLSQDIDEYTSDCVGFKVNHLLLITPSDPRARLASGSIEEIFSEGVKYPAIKDIYKVKDISSLTAGQRRAIAFAKAGAEHKGIVLQESGKKAKGKFLSESQVEAIKKTYSTSIPIALKKTYIVKSGNTDNSNFRKNAYATKRGMGSHSGIDINADGGARCYSPADGVVIGVKAFKGSGFTFQIQHTEEYGGVTTWWMHMQKIYVHAGQKVRRGELVGKVGNTQDVDGSGSTSNHIHFEVLWPGVSTLDDPKYPGSKSPNNFYLRKNPKDWLKEINVGFYKEHKAFGRNNAKPNNQSGHDEEQNKPIATKKRTKQPKTDFRARKKWIEAIEKKYGYKYYDKDTNVKNMFYKETKKLVTSDFVLQKSGKSLPNIVCSSISISFGHRIAPMHVIGQDYYTYQFLGRGNKTGTMVFTYAGEEGRKSAQEIKNIINIAHNNSRYYHFIPESGSITLESEVDILNEKNTLLRLLDISNITVTKVNDYSLPDGSDKHQLVIEFIAQEFAEEKLELKLEEKVDDKLSIFKTIAKKYLDTRGKNRISGTPIIVVPHPSVAVGSSKEEGGKWRLKDESLPVWLLDVLIFASKRLTEFNEKLPTVDWLVSPNSTKRWKDIYALFDADHLVWGQYNNIITDKNLSDAVKQAKQIDRNLSAGSINNNYEYWKTFKKFAKEDYATTRLHSDMLNQFEEILEEIVERVNRNRSDISGFRRIFPGISDNYYSKLKTDLGSCYEDLDMPFIPGLDLITLPPDFYVYRDNDESSVGLLNDRTNIENLLTQHMRNEIESVKHYIKDCALGNAYISSNMYKIIQERRDVQDLFDAEYLISQHKYYDGGDVWEPIYNKYDDPEYNTQQGKQWKANVKRILIDGKTENYSITESFMDDVVNVSPYLIQGRKWSGGEPTSREIIDDYYGQAWTKLAFGPNTNHRVIDDKIKGKLSPSFKDQLSQKLTLTAMKKAAKERNETIKQENVFVHPDGSITYGISQEERIATKKEMEENAVAIDGSPSVGSKHAQKFFDQVGNAINDYVEWGAKFTKQVYNALGNPAGLGSTRERKVQDKIEDRLDTFKEISDINKEYNDLGGQYPSMEERYGKIAAGIAIGARENDLSLKRVFPTFKIYFIEDDSDVSTTRGKYVRRAYDDFYSYNSVQDIKIHESQNNPGSIAIITITNVGNKLFNKRFGDTDDFYEEDRVKFGIGAEQQGLFANTNKENPFEKLIMKNGVKVQIRLGYEPDPNNLTTRFLGQIVEVAPIDNGRLIQIVCQSYGAELEAAEMFSLDDTRIFTSAQSALCAAILQPFVVNFGRRSKLNMFNPGEIRSSADGGRINNWSVFGHIAHSLTRGAWGSSALDPAVEVSHNYQAALMAGTFLNDPQDDNIYAPPPWFYANSFMNWSQEGFLFRPIKQTPWEVFKEHELRHPGFISYPVPYGHEPRMTMFFGSKGQHYWSRPPSPTEIELATKSYNEMIQLRGIGSQNLNDSGYINRIKKLGKQNPDLAKAILTDLTMSNAPTNSAREIGKLFGRYVPFRGYHFADSQHHILKNNIRTSIDGTFNHVEVYYTPEGGWFHDDGATAESEADLKESSEEADFYSVKLDENIPENYLRTYREEFPSCFSETMAKRYAQGLFVHGLREMYKGELIVIGNENIKPYDIVHLRDNTNDIHGPVEVKSVTHILNRDTGYVTVIEPGVCMEINDMFNMSLTELLPEAYTYVTESYPQELASAMSATDNPFASTALFAITKIMHFTQDGVPVAISPLTFKGKPFVSTAIGIQDGSLILKEHGKWLQFKEDLSDSYRKFDLSEAFGDTINNIGEYILEPED